VTEDSRAAEPCMPPAPRRGPGTRPSRPGRGAWFRCASTAPAAAGTTACSGSTPHRGPAPPGSAPPLQAALGRAGALFPVIGELQRRSAEREENVAAESEGNVAGRAYSAAMQGVASADVSRRAPAARSHLFRRKLLRSSGQKNVLERFSVPLHFPHTSRLNHKLLTQPATLQKYVFVCTALFVW
jgi:hypothetical protein